MPASSPVQIWTFPVSASSQNALSSAAEPKSFSPCSSPNVPEPSYSSSTPFSLVPSQNSPIVITIRMLLPFIFRSGSLIENGTRVRLRVRGISLAFNGRIFQGMRWRNHMAGISLVELGVVSRNDCIDLSFRNGLAHCRNSWLKCDQDGISPSSIIVTTDMVYLRWSQNIDFVDVGKILAGIQVPPADRAALEDYLRSLDYTFWDETENTVYKRFLKKETGGNK